MDLTQSIEPRSDQINSDDLIAGPITYTIREVITGKAESPFDFLLVETDRAYRPSKTMRRVIVNAWGPEASAYTGRRLTLYREPSIMFGGQKVGGIRISHMSHIDGRKKLALAESKGKKSLHVVDPLPDDAPTAPPVSEDTVARLADLRAEWKHADPERKKAIEAEVASLSAPDAPAPESAEYDPTTDPTWGQR